MDSQRNGDHRAKRTTRKGPILAKIAPKAMSHVEHPKTQKLPKYRTMKPISRPKTKNQTPPVNSKVRGVNKEERIRVKKLKMK